MVRGYKDIATDRRARLTPESLAQREVVEKACDISRIERGSTSPTARTLQRIAEALDADVRLVAHRSPRDHSGAGRSSQSS
jgi:transcriptional regulator with XRE-family HTH domain